MKSFKFKSIILVAVLLLSQSVMFANDGNPATDYSKVYIKKSVTEKGLTLRLVNLQEIATAIYMKDAEQHELFRKAVKEEDGAVLKLDLSKLENGSYSLFIERERKVYIQTLTIENGELSIVTMKEIFKPNIIAKKKSFIVDGSNLSIKKVEVLNSNDTVVYEKAYTDANDVKINFSLKQIPAGEYLVKVTTADNSYYKSISVK